MSGAVLPKQDLIWVIIACIIPDIPWIILKLILASDLVGPYDARLYCTAQASLLFCLLLSGTLALLVTSSTRVFLILSVNSFFHLALDSIQIKWGNGVHFIAPLSWKMFHVDLFWPEFIGVIGLTAFGFFYLLRHWKQIGENRITVTRSRIKFLLALCLFAAYLLGPLAFKQQMEKADTYYISTMRHKEERTGKPIELDRAHYFAENKEVKVYSGETFRLTGSLPEESGRVSFKGVFSDPDTIVCSAYHRSGNYRDYASMAGLFMACTLLMQSLILAKFKRRVKNETIRSTRGA